MLGQSPRELREGAFGARVSPDGTRIAFAAGAVGDLREIWMADSQGENPQKVLALPENEFIPNGALKWSPDGERLAYIRVQRTQETYQTSIETCDLRGANRTVVLASLDLFLQDLSWLPDRRIVYARQESPGSNDYNLWQIGIDRTAAPTSEPKRITQWAGSSLLNNLSSSADGKRLALQKSTYQDQIYLGELEARGTRMNSPRRLTNDEANDWPYAWTPDSKAVLLDSDRSGSWGIFKQGIGEATAQPVITRPQDVEFPLLSPDDAWILYQELPKRASKSSPNRLMRVPIGGGVAQFVLETQNGWHMCARAPASLCVVVEESQDQKQLTITAFDPLKGRGKVLRTIQKGPTADFIYGLSPDGSTFAFSRHREPEIHIRLFSLSGGSDREITVKGWPNLAGLYWSPDGKGMYCGSVSPQGGGALLYVDLAGSARLLWQHKGEAGDWFYGIPSPDGRYLAMLLGTVTNSNVWMLEGF